MFELVLSWSCAGFELILSFVGGSLIVNLFGELRLTYNCLSSVELYLQVSVVDRRDGYAEPITLSDEALVCFLPDLIDLQRQEDSRCFVNRSRPTTGYSFGLDVSPTAR